MIIKHKSIHNKTKDPYVFIRNKDLLQEINLYKDRTIIVPHVCNNINAFGAGFAADVGNVFPIVKENFHLLGNKAKLGRTQFVDVTTKNNKNKLFFANMIAQNGVINNLNKRPLNYYALANSMYNVKLFIDKIKNDLDIDTVEIHAPKFGSGLAGGNWNFISDLIYDIWSSDTTVFIYQKK